jgi:hypothetical protein
LIKIKYEIHVILVFKYTGRTLDCLRKLAYQLVRFNGKSILEKRLRDPSGAGQAGVPVVSGLAIKASCSK